MDAQFALANVTDYSRIKSANIYNGPNIYSTLTEEQKINVSALYDKINNYVDSRDLVGLGYKKGERVEFLEAQKRIQEQLNEKSFLPLYPLYGEEDYLLFDYKKAFFQFFSENEGINSMVVE